ncbi:MAG: ATP-binding protein [Bacteroidales bacterium]
MNNFLGLPGFGLVLQIVMLFAISDKLFGQAETDSLNTLLNRANSPVKKLEILFQLSENELNYQNAITYAERAIQLADSLGLPFEKAKALNLSGVAWKNCGDSPKSIEKLYAALDYFQKSGDEISCGEVLMNIGETYRASAKREKSTEYLNRALAIFKKRNDSTGMAKTYNRLAANSYEKFVNLSEYKLLNNIHKIQKKDIFNELFKSPVLKQEHDSLFFYLDKSDYFAQSAKQEEVRVSTAITRAAFYTAAFCTDSSVVIYERIMKDIINSKTNRDLPLVMINLARMYSMKIDFNKSNFFAKQAFDLGKKRHIKIYTLLSCFQLRDNYYEEGKFDSAYFWYDSLYLVNNQFRRDEFTLELNLLNKENEINTKEIELKNHLSKLQLLGVFAFIILVSFSVFTLILLKKNKRQKILLAKLNQKNQIINDKNTELASANAQKDKFFSIIAHDLRGPFNGFLGLTQLLAEGISSFTLNELQEISMGMNKSANNLYNLLNNLLEWSRMQQGTINFEPKAIPILPFATSTLQTIMDPATKKGIDVTIDIPENLQVFADENMLASTLRNLASNAVKFTPSGGKVSVTAKPTVDNKIEISVKDTGIGMDAEMLENMFKLDVSISRMGTDGEPSTGLGLLLCKDFIEKQGGRIWADSEEGNGSTVYFTLPIMEAKAQHKMESNTGTDFA